MLRPSPGFEIQTRCLVGLVWRGRLHLGTVIALFALCASGLRFEHALAYGYEAVRIRALSACQNDRKANREQLHD